MRLERLVLGPLDTNCWLVGDESAGPLIVIDPAAEPDVVIETIGERPVAAVVLTHCHFDHLGAVGAVLEACGGELLIHAEDASFITSPEGTGGAPWGFEDVSPPADRALEHDDVVEAGEITLRVLHTPGHTPGCISLLGEGRLFSGDTLFAGSVGRTDFPRGDARRLQVSIASSLAPLPDETVVHPGHGPDTTIGRERRVNPFFPRA